MTLRRVIRESSRHGAAQDPTILSRTRDLPGRDREQELHESAIEEGMKFPILVMTARDRFADMVAGFKSGADDFLRKPVQNEELLIRL